MQKFRHPVLALLVLATLSPTVAWGQPEKVGVVATLEGSVTARRAILPQPVALKFKDDVFARDTLTTGDQSLARVLLGGKSIVTIRERSTVTITEMPGRSVVAIRGTVVVAEVLSSAGGPVRSNVYVLRGTGECSLLDPGTGRPIGAPVTVRPLEAFSAIGSTARVDPIPPSQVGQITAGLEGKGYQHIEAANQEQVKGQIAQ